jgi:hypothetical protein
MSFVTKLPDEIFDDFKKKRSCFFVGAGLSIPAGFPTWGGLLDKLIEDVTRRRSVNAEKLSDYDKLKNDPTKFLFLAEDLKSELGSRFYDLMEEWFGSPDVKPTVNHELLVQIPSQLTITINYDRLIENAYNGKYGYTPNFFTYKQSREAANSFWKERYFVLKAHGDASSDPQGLIISQKDYRKTLYREIGYRSLLQTIFSTFSIVFVGVSLNDPEFNQLLDFLHESYHGGGPTHYALLEQSKTPQTLAKRYLEEFKVQTIIYKNEKKDHSDITIFLQEIFKSIK